MRTKSLQSCLTLCNPIDYIALQAPQSMGFSRQGYWSELPCPPPGDLPYLGIELDSLQFSSVTQLCPTLCDPMKHVRPPCPLLTPGVYPNLCPLSQWCHLTISSSVVPLLLLPSMFPNIRVFYSDSVFCIRWPEYWSIYSIPITIFPSGLWDRKRKTTVFLLTAMTQSLALGLAWVWATWQS